MDRDEFMELVYETFADEPDNVLANGIIEAADAYVEHEKTQLSREGTTCDLISRQAAIDAAESAFVRGVFPTVYIRELPPAQPELTDEQVIDYCGKKGYKIVADDLFDLLSRSEPQWIPVSERLPEVGQTIIAQCRANIIKTLKFDSDGDWYQDAEHCYMSGFVVAWMPLPEAYKPKTNKGERT